jgi:hypothetical protein
MLALRRKLVAFFGGTMGDMLRVGRPEAFDGAELVRFRKTSTTFSVNSSSSSECSWRSGLVDLLLSLAFRLASCSWYFSRILCWR